MYNQLVQHPFSPPWKKADTMWSLETYKRVSKQVENRVKTGPWDLCSIVFGIMPLMKALLIYSIKGRKLKEK